MSFMEKQVTDKREWWEIDGPIGIVFFDCEDFTKEQAQKDYSADSPVWTTEKTVGYGARLSAPGYMDCTDWAVFDTVKEAEDYLEDTYPEEED